MVTKFALYVALPSINIVLSEISKFNTLVSTLKRLSFDKVYLENYREGQVINADVMAKVRDMFEKDFEVSGGLAIGTWGEGMGRHADWWKVCACVDDEKNMKVFEKAMVEQAKVFDEVLIDDFWANWCYSEEQVNELNRIYGLSISSAQLMQALMFDPEVARLWAEYSRSLLASTSRNIYSKAKDVNSKVRVILKVAEWREQFMHRGLDLKLMSYIFDGIYVGTESREGTFRYGSLFIIDYVRAFVGDKLRGAWFDSYNGLGIPVVITPEIFVEQLWYSFLGKVDEVTFFQGVEYAVCEVLEACGSGSTSLGFEDRRVHVELAEKSIRLLRKVEDLITSEKRGLISLPIQSPIMSPNDNYLEDVLSSIGVPITSKPIDKITEGEPVLIKNSIVKYVDMLSLLKKGINIILTSATAEDIAKGALGSLGLELLGVDKDKPIVKDVVEAVAFTDDKVFSFRSHRRPYAYSVGPILNIDRDVLVHVYAVDKFGRRYPALYEIKYEKASIIIAPITKYPLDFSKQFPEIVRQVFRDVVAKFVGLKLDVRQTTSSMEVNELSNLGLAIYASKGVAVVNENLHDNYFDIVFYKDKLGITKFNNVALGNIKVEEVIDGSEELRLRVRVYRHSFDVLVLS